MSLHLPVVWRAARLSLALGAVAAVAVACGFSTGALLRQASSDMNCPTDDLTIEQLSFGRKIVHGCGQAIAYRRAGGGWAVDDGDRGASDTPAAQAASPPVADTPTGSSSGVRMIRQADSSRVIWEAMLGVVVLRLTVDVSELPAVTAIFQRRGATPQLGDCQQLEIRVDRATATVGNPRYEVEVTETTVERATFQITFAAVERMALGSRVGLRLCGEWAYLPRGAHDHLVEFVRLVRGSAPAGPPAPPPVEPTGSAETPQASP